MKGRSLPVIVGVLLGILLIASIGMSLGENDTMTRPSASSYTPSGTRAFVQLLRDLGYRVRVSRSKLRSSDPKEIVFAYEVGSKFKFSEETELLREKVSSGGSVVLFGLPERFPQVAEKAVTADYSSSADMVSLVTNLGGTTHTIDLTPQGSSFFGMATQHLTLATTTGGVQVATLQTGNRGKLLQLFNGVLATNRYIDRNDNAAELLQLLQSVAPTGSSILIDEASFAEAADPSILERMGTWAVAAWWQMLLLLGIIAYGLGKPFGYPDEERPGQKGARELVDAVAETFRRARAGALALSSLNREAESEIRRKLKLSRDQNVIDHPGIPLALRESLVDSKVDSRDHLSSGEALDSARKLEINLAEFLGKPVIRRRRRRHE